MRRIQPPKCSSCKIHSAVFESDVWPSLRLCTGCWTDAIEFCFSTGVIHGNPLLLHFADVGDNGNRDNEVRVWRRRVGQGSTFFEFFIRRTDESENNFDTTLDLLNNL